MLDLRVECPQQKQQSRKNRRMSHAASPSGILDYELPQIET